MNPRPDPGADPVLYGVAAVYLGLLLGVGWMFRRFNRNTDDYFRMGARGTWWLVGVSVYISNISAWTFTGGAGQAFEWGWSILFNYWPIGLGFLLCALVFAPWFRQLRATTGPEAIGLRFDDLTRQVFGWKCLVAQPLVSAIQLYGLAIFASSVLGFPLGAIILVLGTVVTLYAALGGRVALMATDFLQAAIILPMAVVMALLCLQQFGGIEGFFRAIDAAGLTERYALVKGEVRPPNGTYGPLWVAAAILFFSVLNNLNLGVAGRFFAVKDSREARHSAWLACGLVFVGAAVWFVPPITARLLFSEQVAGLTLSNPSEGAYAVAALQLLPNALVGVMLVAICAATLGSMDGALNANAAVAVRDLYPALCRRFGWRGASEVAQLRAARGLTFAFGGTVMAIALSYAQLKELTLFDLIMNVLGLTGLPFQVPLFWGFFVRKVPRWSALFAAGVTAVAGLLLFFDQPLLGVTVPWHIRVLIQFGIGTAAFLSTRLCWQRVGSADRAHVEAFFRRLHTPVDFQAEVGEPSDRRQLRLAGTFTTLIGAGVLTLAAFARDDERLVVLGLAAAYLALAGTLLLLARPPRLAARPSVRTAAPPGSPVYR